MDWLDVLSTALRVILRELWLLLLSNWQILSLQSNCQYLRKAWRKWNCTVHSVSMFLQVILYPIVWGDIAIGDYQATEPLILIGLPGLQLPAIFPRFRHFLCVMLFSWNVHQRPDDSIWFPFSLFSSSYAPLRLLITLSMLFHGCCLLIVENSLVMRSLYLLGTSFTFQTLVLDLNPTFLSVAAHIPRNGQGYHAIRASGTPCFTLCPF